MSETLVIDTAVDKVGLAGQALHRAEVAVGEAKRSDKLALTALLGAQQSGIEDPGLLAAHQTARDTLHELRLARTEARTALKVAKIGHTVLPPASSWHW